MNVEGEFKSSTFPTLGSTVSHAVVSPHEPDFRFLVCTSNGIVSTYIRTSDEFGLKKGLEAEFTTIDSWDVLNNPHGLEQELDQDVNSKLYKISSKAVLTAEFSLNQDSKHIVAIVDLLQ